MHSIIIGGVDTGEMTLKRQGMGVGTWEAETRANYAVYG